MGTQAGVPYPVALQLAHTEGVNKGQRGGRGLLGDHLEQQLKFHLRGSRIIPQLQSHACVGQCELLEK